MVAILTSNFFASLGVLGYFSVPNSLLITNKRSIIPCVNLLLVIFISLYPNYSQKNQTLMFGPNMKVLEPKFLVEERKRRIDRQYELFN
jgi:hypothetical protein